MAWLILVLLAPILTYASDKEVCLDQWEWLDSSERSQWVANGHFYDKKPSDPTTLLKKSIQGDIKEEIKLPFPPDNVWQDSSFPDGFLYSSGGNNYLYYDKTKENILLPKGAHILGEYTNLYEERSYFHLGTKTSFVLPANTKTKGNLFVTSGQKTITFIDATSKKSQVITLKDKDPYVDIRSERVVITSNAEEEETIFIKQKGTWIEFKETSTKSLAGTLPTGELLVLNIKSKTGRPESINTYDPVNYEYTTDILDDNGNLVKRLPGLFSAHDNLVFSPEGEYAIKDFANHIKNNTKLVPVMSARADIYDQKDDLVYYKDHNEVFVKDLATGKSYPIPYGDDRFELKSTPEKIILSGHNKESIVIDKKTGKITNLSMTADSYIFDPYSTDYLRMNPVLSKKAQTCYKGITIVPDDCDCSFKNDPALLSTKNPDKLTRMSLCASGDGEQWKKYLAIGDSGEITTSQAQLYLNQFQKYGVAISGEELNVLVAILKSNMVETHTYEIIEVLKKLNGNPELLASLYANFNLEKRFPKKIKKDAFICPSATTTSRTQQQIIDEFVQLASDTENREGSDAYVRFLPYKYDLQELPEKQKKVLVDQIGENLSQQAAIDKNLSGVFASKLYYFSKKFALSLFGEDSKPATDISATNSSYGASIIVMSSSPMAQQNIKRYDDIYSPFEKYGFSYDVKTPTYIAPDTKVGSSFKQEVEWKNEQGNFSATIDYKVQAPISEILPRDSSPNYKAMKKDGAVTGMMIIGTNLAGHPSLSDEYLTYYQNEGFKFSPPQTVEAYKYFKDEIESGKLDYFIKEAHSDGDDKNLFRINKEGTLLTGTRTRNDGTKEIIHLVVPKSEADLSILISNHDFGEWMRKRSADSPLYYFNSSCESSSKVISELTATHSENFIPIATTSLAYTFSTKPTNAMNAMLTAFRSEKDYDGIRAYMTEKSPRYAAGVDDQFIFPDEESYEEAIIDRLKLNLDIKVKVKDSKGQEIHMDEQLDHD